MAKYDIEQLIPTIDAIIRVSDMNVMSMKRLRLVLSAVVNTNLSEEKDALHKLVVERIKLMQSEGDKGVGSYKGSEKQKRDLERDNLVMAQRMNPGWSARGATGSYNRPRDKPKGKTKNPGSANRGAKKLYKLHPKLAEFMHKETSDRFEITKEVWRYIKDHNLQNPDNKREIIADDNLASIFKPRFDMFFIAKKLGEYLLPMDEDEQLDDDEVVESSSSSSEAEETLDPQAGERIVQELQSELENPDPVKSEV